MCFIEKSNCISICKREDRVSDPVRTLGRVGYWERAPDNNLPNQYTLTLRNHEKMSYGGGMQ